MAVTMAWDAIGFSMFSGHLSLLFLIKIIHDGKGYTRKLCGAGGHRPEAY